MKKILSSMALLSFFLLSVNVTHAAGIVFDFGANVTAERQTALEAAAAELEQIIHFKQDIKVQVSFAKLECDESSALLGFAGPKSAYPGADISGAPQNDVWYVSAQAADFGYAAAMDETVHIVAQFSSKIGTAACPNFEWYYGLDHNPGPGQLDFLGTAVHEFMHGLGFLSLVDSSGKLLDNNGSANSGHLDNYSAFLFNNNTGKSWKNMTDGERASSILNDGIPSNVINDSDPGHVSNLVWNGAKTIAMDSLLQTGTTGGKVRLFAPSIFQQGSSTSHFDISVHYNSGADEVMEPYDSFPLQNIMASAAFCDMGWDLVTDFDNDAENDCIDAAPLVFNDADIDGTADALDAFPSNPAASSDIDHDGEPDAWNQPNPYSCAINASTCNGLTLDSDSDGDGVLDVSDNCRLVANANQLDYDNDGIGNVCGDDIPMLGITGAINADKVGSAVAFAGDVNGDGYGDYVVGMPGYDIPAAPPVKIIKGAGRAEVISGKTGAVLMSINGVAAKDAMGFAVAGNGDIDHDGFDDVVVGAPKADDIANKHVDAGSVTVLYGRSDVDLNPAQNETFYGAAAKILSGSAVALGKVNNDIYADIIIGAPKADDVANKHNDAGSVTIIDGNTLVALPSIYYGSTTKAYAGTSVAAGNVDAVAGADIIIGAPNDDDLANKRKDAGSVTVYNIADTTTPVIPKQYGAVAKAFLGKSVAAGDVNNDGYADVIAGAPGDDKPATLNAKKVVDSGSVTVFYAADALAPHTFYGATAKAGLGNSVAAGNVDGDVGGKADIIAGASKDDVPATDSAKKIVDAGSVSIFSGSGYGLIGTLHGEAAKDYLGFAVSAGDINSDGKADLIIGISGDDILATKTIKDGGTVKIVSGVTLL